MGDSAAVSAAAPGTGPELLCVKPNHSNGSNGSAAALPARQYYVQTDSALPGQAYRMCFSSTCAMAVKYLRPGALVGVNADDAYLLQ